MRIELNISERPSGIITLQRYNQQGKQTASREFPMHSMTQNYWRVLNHCLRGELSGNPLVRMDGSFSQLSGSTDDENRFSLDGGASDIWGIQVGRDATEVKLIDAGLSDHIPHGSIANTLNYLENNIISEVDSVTLLRIFENLSGEEIVLNEAGLFVRREIDSASDTNPYMYARDVLEEPFPIPNSDICTITSSMAIGNGTRNVMAFLRNFSGVSATETFYLRGGGTAQLLPIRLNATNSAANDDAGLLLGTGTTPPDIEDIDLDDRVANGGEVGELVYGESTVEPYTINEDDDEISWACRREVTNVSGEDLTVRELGLFASHISDSYMLYRFILPNPVTIVDGTVREIFLTFNYKM